MRRKIHIKLLAWFLAGLMILPSVASASALENLETDTAIEETLEAGVQETATETGLLPLLDETQTGGGITAPEEAGTSDEVVAGTGDSGPGVLSEDVPAGPDAEVELLEIPGEGEIYDILTSDEEHYAAQSFGLRSSRTSSGSFYQQLTTQEAGFYEQLEAGDLLACAQADEKFVFMQGTDIVVQMSLKDVYAYIASAEYKEERAVCMPMIARAFDAYMKDNPEEFWTRGFAQFTSIWGNPNASEDQVQTYTIRISLKFTLYYEGVLDDVTAVQSALQTAEDTIRGQLNGQTDRYTVAAEIHEYVTELMSYPPPSALQQNDYRYWHTLSGPLLSKYNHQGVCEGYAKLFKYLCNQFDVPCMIIAGSSVSGGDVDHMWNYAQMEDGAWYLVDVTWDDGTPPVWTYFMKKAQTFTHAPFGIFSDGISYSAFIYPTLSGTDYTSIAASELQNITLSKNTLSLQMGMTEKLPVIYQPSRPSAVRAAWTSSDSSVATVNSSGTVTAVGAGTAVITVSIGSFSAACTVTVPEVILQGITLSKSTLSLQRGSTGGLTVAYQPGKPSNVSAAWTSSNSSVATVNSSGTVTAVGEGTAAITASAGSFKATCTVTVTLTSRMMIEDFVTRLYKLVLGRGPDAGGLTYWADLLQSKQKTGVEVAYGFFFSDEYISKKVSDSTFVETLYGTLLDRNSDASGKAYWLNYLSTGVTRYYIFAGFANANEFAGICNKYQITRGSYQSTAVADQNVNVTAFVSRMYTVCLGRSFDRAGLDDWVGRLLKGETTGRGIVYGFFFSTEFKNKNTSHETFVALAYKTLFDRNPDTAGYNDWVGRLRSGQSRETVLNGFIGSTEFTKLCTAYGIRKE